MPPSVNLVGEWVLRYMQWQVRAFDGLTNMIIQVWTCIAVVLLVTGAILSLIF